MSDLHCTMCPHACFLREGETGFCHVRTNYKGQNVNVLGNRIAALAMDPIEKKPLYHFYPGSHILSVGTYGCNLHCMFCQNHWLSMPESISRGRDVSPEELAEVILSMDDNLGIAFTYNEPLLNTEYIIETARRIRPYGKKTVLVSNGCFSASVQQMILPYVDAMNIDLKGPASFYRKLQGDYDTVHRFIEESIKYGCHVEVTTLVVPGKSDDEEWVCSEAAWLASLDKDTVYHLTRYFPAYKSTAPATDPKVLYDLQKAAKMYLDHVYVGNI